MQPQTMARTINKGAAVELGQVVRSVYEMDREINTDPLRPTPILPPGYDFVAWVQMQDYFFEQKIDKFYGVIARKTGVKREYVLAIRGIVGDLEWADAIVALEFTQWPGFGGVGKDFDLVYKSMAIVSVSGKSFSGSFA